MTIFLIESDQAIGKINGVTAVIVEADSSADAIALLNSQFAQDSSWTGATATALSSLADADFLGYTWTITLSGGSLTEPLFAEVIAGSIDDVGTGLRFACNAHPDIAAATYTDGTNVLEISEISDDIGDATVTLTVRRTGFDKEMTIFTGAIVHEGIAAAQLTVTLLNPTIAPTVFRRLKGA